VEGVLLPAFQDLSPGVVVLVDFFSETTIAFYVQARAYSVKFDRECDEKSPKHVFQKRCTVLIRRDW
jgi:hypothetical protein